MKAVCARCGTFKEHAWKRCKDCNYRPVGDEEKAKSLLLSTHFNDDKKLAAFSTHIKEKKEIEFKDKDLAMVTEVLKHKHQHNKSQKIYMAKLVGSFLLTIVLNTKLYESDQQYSIFNYNNYNRRSNIANRTLHADSIRLYY